MAEKLFHKDISAAPICPPLPEDVSRCHFEARAEKSKFCRSLISKIPSFGKITEDSLPSPGISIRPLKREGVISKGGAWGSGNIKHFVSNFME